ncbi:MAG: tetratricopeptide repeat protein [candidate division KSB1 bacterium]|nr:tetratricopeptide repeat protein [candidate division KSB1 bacterium]
MMMGNVMLSWSNLPFLSPVLLIILASVIFILLYLYKTSSLMNKKTLTWLLLVTAAFFFIAAGLLWLKNRPPRVKFRLLLLPVQCDAPAMSSCWLGTALLEQMAEDLQKSVTPEAIIVPPSWLAPILKPDSVTTTDYIHRIIQQFRGDNYLASSLIFRNGSPWFRYMLIDVADPTDGIADSVALSPQKIPELVRQISSRILSHFGAKPGKSPERMILVSPAAYQAYLTAETYLQQEQYLQAIAQAQRALAMDSTLSPAYCLIGQSYFLQALAERRRGVNPEESFENARRWLTLAIDQDSASAEAYQFLGEYAIYRERWSVAEEMLDRAYRLNPNDPRLYLTVSRLHASRYPKFGFQDEEELYRHAIFLNPGYGDAYLMLSDHFLFKNNRQLAIQVLEEYLKINPNSVPALMALGKIYLVRNEILKIIEVFNRVLQLDPNNADAFYNLGILYYNSKDFDTAEKFFARAIAINNHPNAHLYLAYLQEARGNYELAIAHLRQRIRLRQGEDDAFAEEARKHLYQLMHRDSTRLQKESQH